jgi:hypothetical protein
VTDLAATGTVRLVVPAGAIVELDAVADAPLAPQVIDSQGRGPVGLRAFRVGDEATAAPMTAADRGRHAARLSVAATEGTAVGLIASLGGIPRRAVARVLSAGATPCWVCRVGTTGLLRGPDRTSAIVTMTRDDQSRLVGAGWSAVEADDAGPYRWMTATTARLVLPARQGGWSRLRLEAFRGPGEDGPGEVAIRVGEAALPAQPVQPGWRTYEWTLPAPPVDAAPASAVEVEVTVDRLAPAGTAAPRGLAVSSLRFARDGDGELPIERARN